jgi:hypothetical protein
MAFGGHKIAALEEFATRHDLRYECDAPAMPTNIYVYSRDKQYRYAFARLWGGEGPVVLWVGVNPGKGDTEDRRRPTLDRCIEWSKSWWGAAGLMFGNLFAARHNTPKALRDSPHVIGQHNDAALTTMIAIADRTVVAWGNAGRLWGRATEVDALFSQSFCLGVTAAGEPRHPLYVPRDTPPERWSRRTRS